MGFITYGLKKTFEKIGKEYIKELKKQLEPHKATGLLENSLKYNVIENNAGSTIEIIAAKYLINVDKGRKAGKDYIYGPILGKWARAKGFALVSAKGKFKTWDELGWAISRSIYNKNDGGYSIKPTNVLEKTKVAILNNEKLMSLIVDGALAGIVEQIDRAIGDLNPYNKK